jgi:hypothetical protein
LQQLLLTSAVVRRIALQGTHLEQQVAVDEPGGVAQANQLHQLRQLQQQQQQSACSSLRVPHCMEEQGPYFVQQEAREQRVNRSMELGKKNLTVLCQSQVTDVQSYTATDLFVE